MVGKAAFSRSNFSNAFQQVPIEVKRIPGEVQVGINDGAHGAFLLVKLANRPNFGFPGHQFSN